MENKEKVDFVSHESGMGTPPTHLPVPPPYNEMLSANSYVPISNILTQTRDILYPQTMQQPQNAQQIMLNNENNRSMTTKTQHTSGDMIRSQPSAQNYQQQQQQEQAISTTLAYSNSATPAKTHGIHGEQPPIYQILQMLDTRLGQIEKHLSGLNIKWQNTDATLRNQNMRITNIEGHINDLTNVKRDMVRVENRVELMNNGMKKTDERMRDYEQSLQVFNDKCEDVMSDSRVTDAAVNRLYDKVEQLEADRQKLNESNQRLNETVIDLQCRSMRDNLIFTGIEEPDYRVDQQEDTEQVLCEFLKYEMNIEPNIPFHRVHRLGYNQRYTDYPRPIVAKFEHFKDRELVRLAAPKTLRGKHYGVREQFPKVVEDKRKLLYPEMKRAKADKTNKVRLVRDKLFVNNIEVKPNLKQVANQNEFELRGRSRDRHHTHRFDDRRAFDRSESGYAKSRVFQRSTNKNTVSSTTAIELAHGRKFQLPLSNKFDGLQTLQDDEDLPPITRKHKASSPLDYDKSIKKHRESQDEESQDSDSSISFTETNNSPQCDPPANTVRFANSSPEKTITVTHIPDSAPLNHGPVVSRVQTSTQDKSNSIIVE